MKSIIIKIVSIIILTTVICFVSSTTYATSLDEIITQADGFLNSADDTAVIDEEALKDTSNTIYNTLFTIALVLAVAVGMIIGIQFMLGSVDEKAKIKETLIPYAVGVFIIFGAFGIWKLAIELGEGITPTNLEKNSGTYERIESGEVKVSDLTDQELKSQFSYHEISGNLSEYINPRQGEGMSLSEAVKELSTIPREIYQECKERGLLNDSGTGLKE